MLGFIAALGMILPKSVSGQETNLQGEAWQAPVTVSQQIPWDQVPSQIPSQIPSEVRPSETPRWWDDPAQQMILDRPQWVSFGLDTILLDTLDHSPRIQIVTSQTSMAIEKIVQQDAAFDPRVLFDSRLGRNNDPVGNSLTTGGPPRLIEDSLTASGGIQQTTRRGGLLDVSQEVGLLNSNSTFFDPTHQGNARLSLSLTQPLLARGGQVYNERLLTQARIDGRVSWSEMRGEVETRVSDVIAAYWRLYELRCHYLQTVELLRRGQEIETFLSARMDFDAGEIELAKVRGRVARRMDREVRLRAEIKKQQATLAMLVGSEALTSARGHMEMIPSEVPDYPAIDLNLRDAVQTGIENRPEIRTATAQLESAGLSIRVTRTELQPKLAAVFEAYLAGLNGNRRVLNSWTDQFTQGGPGMAAGLQYELPYGRRAAKAKHREAQHRYRLRSEELREVVQQTQAEIEIALVSVLAAVEGQTTKQRQLETAITEERVLSGRWESIAGDGASAGVVLETLLDAQSRRTDAEKQLVSSQTQYVIALVQLQRAMGTLLTKSGVTPVQDRCDHRVQFITDGSRDAEIERDIDVETEMTMEREITTEIDNSMLLTDPVLIEIPPAENSAESTPANPTQNTPEKSPNDLIRDDITRLVDASWLEEEVMYGGEDDQDLEETQENTKTPTETIK